MSVGIRILLLLNLVLGLGVAALWLDETGQPRPNPWVPPAPIVPEVGAPKLSPPADPLAGNAAAYPALLERPLFAADRRPPPPPPPPPPPDPLRDVQILGIVTGEKGYVLARVEGRTRRLAQGESIGEWKLDKLEGRDVTFVQAEGQTRQIRLQYARIGAQPRSAAQAGAASGGATPGSDGAANTTATLSPEEQRREALRRRNEYRAARGLPPLTE